jgi:hypothetical protein
MTNRVFSNGYALLIGTGADLPVTVKDATAVRDLLINLNQAGYPSKQVKLLCDVSASRQGILNAFDWLASQVNQNLDATVFIYYSGHGGYIKDEEEYFLVPNDYNPLKRRETTISGLDFTQKVETIHAKKLTVWLDCCHAGGIPALKDSGMIFVKSSMPTELVDLLESGSGRVIIASSRDNEYSYTGEPYSVFTNCLIEALQGKATVNQDGCVRILDVLIYLFNQVPHVTNGLQHPFVKKVLNLGDNFPLCYCVKNEKITVSTPSSIETIESSLTSGQKWRLQQKLNMLQEEWNLRSQKVNRLRRDSVIEASTATKFQLEQHLLDEEVKLGQISDQMNEIERILQL